MTQKQIEKYEQLKSELEDCERAISVGVSGIFCDRILNMPILLPGAICLEIEEVIKKWIDHYKKEIEKL